MISEQKLEANRLNAQKSTGPRSAEGKAGVSQNPVTHGCRSRHAVLLTENRAEFDEQGNQLVADWQPKSATEYQLIENMHCAAWRMARLEAMISHVLLLSPLATFNPADCQTGPGTVAVPLSIIDEEEQKTQRMVAGLSQQQARLERQYIQSMKTLAYVQKLHPERTPLGIAKERRAADLVRQVKAEDQAIELAAGQPEEAVLVAAAAGSAPVLKPLSEYLPPPSPPANFEVPSGL
jgi:hypothetical protein